MNIIGPPPRLTQRAAEQIREMGVDSALGFQRLRSISRSVRFNDERLSVLRAKKSNLENEQTRRAPYPSELEKVREIAEEVREITSEIHGLESKNERLHQDSVAVSLWHAPVVRVLDSVLKELGFGRVEQVLPDFDDGISAEINDVREAAEQAAASGFRAPQRISR